MFAITAISPRLSTRKRCRQWRYVAMAAVGLLLPAPPSLAADEAIETTQGDATAETATVGAPERHPPLARTFAPTGLLAEFNSNENFGATQARVGTLRAHQAAADFSGIAQGYADKIDGIAVPLKATVPLDNAERFYVRAGLAKSWVDARGDRLTEVDSRTLNGLMSVLYRPDADILLGIGLVATRTDLDFEHNGGTGRAEAAGVQADYVQRFSDQFGLAARLLYDWGDVETMIPLGNSGRSLSITRDTRRLYTEGSLIGNFTARDTGVVPQGWKVRPMATVVYQRNTFDKATNSAGFPVPSSKEKFATLGLAVRVEKDEGRPWHIVPYATTGIDREIANSVSAVDDDPYLFCLKGGLGTNVGGKGRFDLYYARRESFRGSYSAGQITILLSMIF